MVKIVVDTDIIIDFLRNGAGDLPLLLKLQAEEKAELYLSSLTILEIFVGKSSKKRAGEIEAVINSFKIIPVDQFLARVCGEKQRDHCLSITLSDLIIGLTAVFLNAVIATRNKKHFQKIPGLKFFKF